jgi:transposase-like protein
MLAVRWYLRFGLSYRDVEELLAERGIEVGHVTVYRWVQRFAPLLAEAARPERPGPAPAPQFVHTTGTCSSVRGRRRTLTRSPKAWPRPGPVRR